MKQETLKGITGQSLEELREKKKKADQRERKRRSRAKKSRMGSEQSPAFAADCHRRGLTWFGFRTWDEPARDWADGLRICKHWARVSHQEGPKPGETLFDFENRIYSRIEVFEPETPLYVSPLMNGNFTGYDPNRELVLEKSYLSARVRELDSWTDDHIIVSLDRAVPSPVQNAPVADAQSEETRGIPAFLYDSEAYREKRKAEVDAEAKRGSKEQHELAQKDLNAVRGASFPVED
jgi:hypothetical protein